MRKLRPITNKQRLAVAEAIVHLTRARRLLLEAGCPKTLERVRGAIKSAGGAHRHAIRRAMASGTYWNDIEPANPADEAAALRRTIATGRQRNGMDDGPAYFWRD